MDAIIGAIVTPVVESLMVPIKKHLRYLISCTKYVTSMHAKKRVLNDAKTGVENHMIRNKSNNLEIPTEVRGWLDDVGNIDAQVESIPSDVGSCFNIKVRHQLGRKAFKIIQEIDRLMEEKSSIDWTDHPIPLGKVVSMKESTSTTPSNHHNDFKSREPTFMEALKALHPDHKGHMIALCGMGGVGKTVMVHKLKKAASEKKLFDFIVEAAIGEKVEVSVIQQAIADFLGLDLKESSRAARAIKLRKSFEALSKSSDGQKKKFLIILDDVWQFVDLNDIGLSPLPDQGVDFKVLLTSRSRDVCTTMGVELDSILDVKVIENSEAYRFLLQFVKVSDDDDDDLDLDLREIGEDIASRCHGLPIAIKIIAHTLKGKSKCVWEDARFRLENKNVDEAVHQVFEISYKNLHDEETRSTLLMCCLFPEDFDTPTEELVRYGWGLRIFKKVDTIRKARNRLNTCIERLIHANLLIQSEEVGCVKMHDLVRTFVLDLCTEGEHASVVGDMSKWLAKPLSEFCKRISLTCAGTSEFPRDRKYPNLLLLKLMHGEKSFPENFYGEMKKLEVIAYERMKHPLIPRSLQHSSNLRVLCLHQCSMRFDLSAIGNLLNLEILSFTDANIQKLPSTIENLKELKLLDLTGCNALSIDAGLLKSLVKLEELYMRGVGRNVGVDGDELVDCSKNLDAIEIEFFGNNVMPKEMSFEKLERFKISLGSPLGDHYSKNTESFGNTLMLVTNKCELLDSKVNDLFGKTMVLHLQVDGINDLEDGLGESLHHFRYSFFSLRVLDVCECKDLRYLFTVRVANGLKQLERLKILKCPALETFVNDENCEVEVIKLPSLKFLSLNKLPMLMSLCKMGGNVIEFPQLEELVLDDLPKFTSIYQDFLRKEVMSSKLKNLKIREMEQAKEIWPSQLSNNDQVTSQLTEISVESCHNLVNLFPSNPMSLLQHLEKLTVSHCKSIDVIFNIDLESSRVAEIEESISSNLRRIEVKSLWELREVWRVQGVNNSNLPILGFQIIESMRITYCDKLRNVFTPITSNFDMRALKEVMINDIHCWGENTSNTEEINVVPNEDILEEMDDDDIRNVAFPSYLIHTFPQLHTLHLRSFRRAKVVFKIESSSCRKLGGNKEDVDDLIGMKRNKTHYDGSQLILVSQQQPTISSLRNLTNITLLCSPHIKYLFSPLIAKLLSNLINIKINSCYAMEEVVSTGDDEYDEVAASISSHTNTTPLPHLENLVLEFLSCLKRINGVGNNNYGVKKPSSSTVTASSIYDHKFQCYQVGVAYWFPFQHLKTITLFSCETLLTLIPSQAVRHMLKLEKLNIKHCSSMQEIFEIEGVNKDLGDNITMGSDIMSTIPRPINMTSLELPNLKAMYIGGCHSLKYIFTSSVLKSLKKLKELTVEDCKAMQVIVKEDNIGEEIIGMEDVVFPRLTSLTLIGLPNLKGFFFGKNDFRWPSLDEVKIYGCPQLMIFTSGRSMAPKLKYMNTSFGKHSLECGLNFDWTNAILPENQLYNSSTRSADAVIIKLLQYPWSFSNLIELDMNCFNVMDSRKYYFPFKEFLELQNLVKPDAIEEGTNDDELMETQPADDHVILISKKNQVMSMDPTTSTSSSSSCIWKSNWWMPSKLSNLTKVSLVHCHSLKHVFSYRLVGSLVQLQELHISDCNNMKVIVEQVQDSKTKAGEVSFPRLKSLKLSSLESLEGFFMGSEVFQWPSLDALMIDKCPSMIVFTNGRLTTPKLKVIETTFGLCDTTEDINSFMRTKIQEGYKF